MEPLLVHDRQNLLEHERQKKSTASAEDDIMDLEEGRQLEWFLVPHNRLNAEDSGQVCHERHHDGAIACHGRFIADISVEMLG